MKVLLDTCTIIWAVSEPSQLTEKVKKVLTADKKIRDYPHVYSVWQAE
jgi:PIN domain nuclease of toxin-antitoxin system